MPYFLTKTTKNNQGYDLQYCYDIRFIDILLRFIWQCKLTCVLVTYVLESSHRFLHSFRRSALA